MPLFPVLEQHERVMFVDDDVVIMRDAAATLFRQPMPPGFLLTANCDVDLWNSKCQRFDVGRSDYAKFFEQAVVPDGAWDKVLDLLREATDGAITYDPKHFQCTACDEPR